MAEFRGNLLMIAIAFASLNACDKRAPASATPDGILQDAIKTCQGNSVISLGLASKEFQEGPPREYDEKMAIITLDCMKKRNFKCDEPEIGKPCNWKPIK